MTKCFQKCFVRPLSHSHTICSCSTSRLAGEMPFALLSLCSHSLFLSLSSLSFSSYLSLFCLESLKSPSQGDIHLESKSADWIWSWWQKNLSILVCKMLSAWQRFRGVCKLSALEDYNGNVWTQSALCSLVTDSANTEICIFITSFIFGLIFYWMVEVTVLCKSLKSPLISLDFQENVK